MTSIQWQAYINDKYYAIIKQGLFVFPLQEPLLKTFNNDYNFMKNKEDGVWYKGGMKQAQR